jgi:hypothetical protein
VNELLQVLQDLVELLRACEEHHWRLWLQADLDRLRAGDMYGLEHLLSAYGGMGSFSDLVLALGNGHTLDADELGNANRRLRDMASRAYSLAKALRSGR